MDKREMLEMALKLVKQCDKYEWCEQCPIEFEDGECIFTAFAHLTNEEMIDELNKKLGICEGHCPDPDATVENFHKEQAADNVNHPKHYETGKFECIDVMVETQGVEAVQFFCICNAFKYVYRHKYKNGCEDIKKAIWYLNKFVELEGEKDA